MTNHPRSHGAKFKVGEKVRCVHGCGVLTVQRVEYEDAWKTTFYYLSPTDLGHQSRELRKVKETDAV